MTKKNLHRCKYPNYLKIQKKINRLRRSLWRTKSKALSLVGLPDIGLPDNLEYQEILSKLNV